jgi:hypothetical protein
VGGRREQQTAVAAVLPETLQHEHRGDQVLLEPAPPLGERQAEDSRATQHLPRVVVELGVGVALDVPLVDRGAERCDPVTQLLLVLGAGEHHGPTSISVV